MTKKVCIISQKKSNPHQHFRSHTVCCSAVRMGFHYERVIFASVLVSELEDGEITILFTWPETKLAEPKRTLKEANSGFFHIFNWSHWCYNPSAATSLYHSLHWFDARTPTNHRTQVQGIVHVSLDIMYAYTYSFLPTPFNIKFTVFDRHPRILHTHSPCA